MEQILQALQSRGYAIDPTRFPTGRPDRATLALETPTGGRVVGKIYPAGTGERTYANMQELWRSSFGERRRPPGLPRPIEYLADVGVLIMERLDGRPLIECGTLDEDMIDDTVRVLASFHDSDAQPSKRRDFRRIVRSVERKANRVAELAPQFAAGFHEVVAALKAAQVEDKELAPCHGDFSPRNVLVAPGRLGLIDWDRLQLADPARDVAYFGTWSWTWALRQRTRADWGVLERTVATYHSLRPSASVESRLRFHVAAGLLRIAHGLIELWPEDAYLAPTLTAEALHQLQ